MGFIYLPLDYCKPTYLGPVESGTFISIMLVEINELQLSDLFFNHEKPVLDEAYALEMDQLGIQEALKTEAVNFSELLGGQVAPQWLVENYNKRV